MFDVQMIKPEMIYDIRHHVLRPHQPMEACKYDTDHDEGAFHVGVFQQGELISVASFYDEKHADLLSNKQYRLRAMATLESYRKQGAGKAVVDYAEDVLQAQGTGILWCKGRTNVQQYYERLGFTRHGDVFDYPELGPHVIMCKQL